MTASRRPKWYLNFKKKEDVYHYHPPCDRSPEMALLPDLQHIAEGIYPIDQTITISNSLYIRASHLNGGGPNSFMLHPTTIQSIASPALQIDASGSQVGLESFILSKSGTGIPEVEVLNGTVELKEVEVNN